MAWLSPGGHSTAKGRRIAGQGAAVGLASDPDSSLAHPAGSMGASAMTMSRAARVTRRMLLPLVLLAGCASATPTQIQSIQGIEGKWAGTVQLGEGEQEFLYHAVRS